VVTLPGGDSVPNPAVVSPAVPGGAETGPADPNGGETDEEVAHRVVRERLEVQAHEVASR